VHALQTALHESFVINIPEAGDRISVNAGLELALTVARRNN